MNDEIRKRQIKGYRIAFHANVADYEHNVAHGYGVLSIMSANNAMHAHFLILSLGGKL